ncbi:O-methyltransferase [Rhizohabitans arisaemae]|uniref:O-methyltransferase n=1 Tax=Rhizohabitans arisaemae TaxID=2720610 RepID=UPI0024B1D34F|nr:class I SAM-dependent methyltransferase [Rhizohabitans arisaemae]
MPDPLRPLLHALRHSRVRSRARAEAARLRGTGDADALLLAEVVERGVRPELSAGERRWVELIEAERRRLSASTETVTGPGQADTSVARITRNASQPWRSAMILYGAVRAFRPEVCVEMGTCVGISAAYQAAALADNGAGRLVTLEGYEGLAAQARKVFANLGLANAEVRVGRFAATLAPALAEEPIDYAYVDGHHHEDATVAYYELIRAHLRPKALLVFDDIDYSAGMGRAWERIRSDSAVLAHAHLGRLAFALVRGG